MEEQYFYDVDAVERTEIIDFSYRPEYKPTLCVAKLYTCGPTGQPMLMNSMPNIIIVIIVHFPSSPPPPSYLT